VWNQRAGQSALALDAQIKQRALQQQLVGSLAGIQGQMFGQAQRQLEEQLLQGQFGRNLAGATAAGGIGYGNDPYQMQLAAAQAAQARAGGQQDQLAQLAAQQAWARALGGV
jgi:hypothetical protein